MNILTKRRFLATAMMGCVFALSACTDGLDSDSEDDGNEFFDVTVKVQDENGDLRDTFYPSETMRMALNIENVTSQTYSIAFEDEQKFDFEVKNSDGDVVWTWSEGQTFDSEPTTIVLEAGQSYGARHNWGLLLNDSSVLPAGEYTLSAQVLHVGETATASFTMEE